jgi:hypothetical protein
MTSIDPCDCTRDILESTLVCLFGCAEVSSNVCAFCTWSNPSLMVGQQKEGMFVIKAHC